MPHARTKKLKVVAERNNFNAPLRYPAFFTIRWTEYVYNLLNAILRNYRASIEYFETHHLKAYLKIWKVYDRLQHVAFLADVLSLLKKFQKACQSDDISILDVSPLRSKFIDSLQQCKNGSIAGGWEELFLGSVVNNQNRSFFHGIELVKGQFQFTSRHRQLIISSLTNHVNMRIDLDASVHDAIQPIVDPNPCAQQDALKVCHDIIASDFTEREFFSDYKSAADLLSNENLSTSADYLQSMKKILPEELHSVKVAIARILIMKPHSADVERLISK